MLSIFLYIVIQEKILNYDLLRDGKPIGTAKVAIKITADGGKRSDSKLDLISNDRKLGMHTTQMWAKSGRPLLKIIQVFDDKGAEATRTRIDFHLTDLLVTQTVGTKITKTTKPIPAKAEIRDLPEFWFLRDIPAMSTPYKYMVFNTTSLLWEQAESSYIGETEKLVDGKSVKRRSVSQKIGQRQNEILLDEGGFPVETKTNDGIRIVAKP